jgi:type II secretory pathway pseudopilin PulG
LLSLAMAARRHRACRGTSLLELLTATGIMVTLLAIGVPQMTRLRAPYAISAASRQIAADLQVARQRAIARNARYRVSFDASAKTYTLERESSSNVFVADGAAQKLAAGVSIGGPSPGNPIFDTRGMLAADVSVTVSLGGAHSRTVTVNVLGRTTIS